MSPESALERYQHFRMIFMDVMRPEGENRYRNCTTIGCGKSFKFTHVDDWTCPACRKARAEMERRHEAEGLLLKDTAKVKT